MRALKHTKRVNHAGVFLNASGGVVGVGKRRRAGCKVAAVKWIAAAALRAGGLGSAAVCAKRNYLRPRRGEEPGRGKAAANIRGGSSIF